MRNTRSRSTSLHELEDFEGVSTAIDDDESNMNRIDNFDIHDDLEDHNIQSAHNRRNMTSFYRRSNKRKLLFKIFLLFLAGFSGYHLNPILSKYNNNNNNNNNKSIPVLDSKTDNNVNNINTNILPEYGNKVPVVHSEFSNTKTVEKPYLSKRYVYMARHDGTTADFQYMSSKLNLTTVNYLNTEALYDFRVPKSEYSSLIDRKFLPFFCDYYDVIFTSDSLADVWGFFMDPKLQCNSTIVFVTTNRLDVGVLDNDLDDWYRDFNRTVNRKDEKRSRIIANNVFEFEYMKYKNIHVPEDSRIIRSFGYSSIPASPVSEFDKGADCLILGKMEQEKDYLKGLVEENTSHKCMTFPLRYGGPHTIAQYNSVVLHLPYQVSTMKMWENANAGIITAVPSAKLFDEICSNGNCEEAKFIFQAKKSNKDDWFNYVEFYLDEFSDCFVQYDTWKELDELLTSKSYLDKIPACKKKMQEEEIKKINQWDEFFMSLP